MSELLLGFDVLAEVRMTRKVLWNRSERENFLLRPEIEQPISVDRGVCPSIFQPSGYRSKDVRVPEWPESEMNMLGFWCDLRRMLNWLGEGPGLGLITRFPIAMQVNVSGSIDDDLNWSAVSACRTTPTNVMEEWPSLGYDVADPHQTSALSNCGYKPNDAERARLRWASHVNEWGLLDHLETAVAFTEFSNARVPEHRPFYVYELFRIEPDRNSYRTPR